MTTVLSLNVRGLNAAVKCQALLIQLRDAQADLCLLQETHLVRADWKGLRSRWFDRQSHTSGPGRGAGVATLLATSFLGRVPVLQAEIPGRLLFLHIDLRGHRLTIANIYGPNEQQESFLRDTLGRIMATPDEDIVLGGDFIIVPDTLLDRSDQRYDQTGAFSRDFRDWVNEARLTDIWRRQYTTERAY
ncbi:hypothetical protein NDU88_000690 [Pleurodeles waltl]|uniref:exodeoxyribonuclease III n=1 Tax=Pleurodeles waltl TaxID=8319 RepID=A0AAV7P1R0_PLEWA|nr:hypothetical protein NDU88_000690 [Pleurodeles waltl]